MLKKSKVYSDLKKAAKSVKDKNILDVFVFGSYVKGKSMPEDIDVCMVFRGTIDDSKVEEFHSKCSKLCLNVHTSPLTVENFFLDVHPLSTTIFSEGISLLDGKSFAQRYGLDSWTLYIYEIAGMKPSEKVKFVYALKGRKGNKGLVREYGGFFASPACFMIPIDKDSEMKEVLDRWKVKYKRKRILLMS